MAGKHLLVAVALGGAVLAAQSAFAQSPYSDPFFGPPGASQPVLDSRVPPPVHGRRGQPYIATAAPSDRYVRGGYDRRYPDDRNIDPSYPRPDYADQAYVDGGYADRGYRDRPYADRPYRYPPGPQPRMVSAPTGYSPSGAPGYWTAPGSSDSDSPYAAPANLPASRPKAAVTYPPIPKADVPKAAEAQFAQCAGNAADATTDSILAACSAIIATGRDSRMAQVYANRARAWHDTAQYKAAIADFDQAIRLNANNAEALQGRCMSKAVLGELQQALVDCNQSLKLQPDNLAALEARGFTYRKLRDFKRSLADYDAVLARQPKNASALFGRGATRLDSGDHDGRADIKQAKEMQSDVAQAFARYGVYH